MYLFFYGYMISLCWGLMCHELIVIIKPEDVQIQEIIIRLETLTRWPKIQQLTCNKDKWCRAMFGFEARPILREVSFVNVRVPRRPFLLIICFFSCQALWSHLCRSRVPSLLDFYSEKFILSTLSWSRGTANDPPITSTSAFFLSTAMDLELSYFLPHDIVSHDDMIGNKRKTIPTFGLFLSLPSL